jgi:hypothetical protein
MAFVVGRELHDDHEREPGIAGDFREEALERGEPARRGPDSDDGDRLAQRPGLRRVGARFTGGDKTQPSSGVVLFILLLAIPLTSAEFSSVLWIGPAASRSTIFCDS